MISLRIQRGITRIELVVVVIIIVLLAGVATSSYRAYVIRSQRADAKDALLALVSQQEQHFLQCNRFANAIDAATSCADGRLRGTNVSRNGWYRLAIPSANATTFTVSATAVNGEDQYQDTPCRTFVVDQAGVRAAVDAGGADNTDECWR